MTAQIPLDTILNNPVDINTGGINPTGIRFFQQLVRAVNMWLGVTTAQVITATAGQTITINPTAATLYLTPAGVLATLIVELPLAPQDGLIVTIKTTQVITALTLSVSVPITILDTVTTLAANGYVRYQFILAENLWIRIG